MAGVPAPWPRRTTEGPIGIQLLAGGGAGGNGASSSAAGPSASPRSAGRSRARLARWRRRYSWTTSRRKSEGSGPRGGSACRSSVRDANRSIPGAASVSSASLSPPPSWAKRSSMNCSSRSLGPPSGSRCSSSGFSGTGPPLGCRLDAPVCPTRPTCQHAARLGNAKGPGSRGPSSGRLFVSEAVGSPGLVPAPEPAGPQDHEAPADQGDGRGQRGVALVGRLLAVGPVGDRRNRDGPGGAGVQVDVAGEAAVVVPEVAGRKPGGLAVQRVRNV